MPPSYLEHHATNAGTCLQQQVHFRLLKSIQLLQTCHKLGYICRPGTLLLLLPAAAAAGALSERFNNERRHD
jgi:hypothetical protein